MEQIEAPQYPQHLTFNHYRGANYTGELGLFQKVCECEAGQQDGIDSHHVVDSNSCPYH